MCGVDKRLDRLEARLGVGGVTHDATDGGQNPSVLNVFACHPPGRPM